MENKSQQTEEIKNEAAAEVPVAEQNEKEQTENASAGSDTKENEMTKLQGELGEAKDKYLRLYSEFENFRRRTAKEKLDLVQSANEQLVKALLPVADDFERAEKSLKDKNDKDTEGFTLIQNKFRKTLEQYGVKPMDIQRGADFDPDLQEAITQIPAPEDKLKGKVVDVVEKGYTLNDKVIRFAKVVVGN